MSEFRHVVVEAYGDAAVAAREASRLVAALDGEVHVEIAVHGPALAQLGADPTVVELVTGTGLPVTVEADPADAGALGPAWESVASVPAFLVEKQWSGWAYLRF